MKHDHDTVASDFTEQCRNGNAELAHCMNAAAAMCGEQFRAAYGEKLLPRPMFVQREEMLPFTDKLTALFGLLSDLPHRLFDGDLSLFCAAIGVDARRAALIRRFPGRPPLHGRADLYHDGDSFRVLEFNAGSPMGGTDRAEISRILLDVPAFQEFADQHRLTYVHTGQRIAHTLRKVAAPITGGADPVVAYVEPAGGVTRYAHLIRSFQEMMAVLGLEVVAGETDQVVDRNGRLYLHGRPIDVILRYFSENHIVADPDGEKLVEPMFRAHDENRVVIWTGLESSLVGKKGCLALLGDSRVRECLRPAERELVDEVLPWSRRLEAGPVDVDGTDVDLLDHCRTERSGLILKPSIEYGGTGIIAGWRTDDAAWRLAITENCGRGFVVQRRVVPRHEHVLDPLTDRIEPWIAVWDAFFTPDGYAGSHIRAVPADTTDPVIRMGADGARTTGVYLHD